MGSPTVTPFTEVWHNGGFLVSEANGHLSRDQVTLVSGTNYLAGMVLGKITTGATATSAAMGTNTGNGTMGAVTLTTVPTQIGTYDVTFTAATAFTVTAPNGATATGSTGSAFSGLGLGFTITAGSTAMVAGDGFDIVTTAKVGAASAAATAKASNTGDATCGTVSCNGPAAQVGVYKVVIVEPGTNVGTFYVEAPDGTLVGDGVVATGFSGGGLSFTLADGSTDFVSGDSFAITVAEGSGKWAQYNPGAVNGSQIAAGILFGAKNATSADKDGVVIARMAEVNASELVWRGGLAASQKTIALAQLKNAGIVAR